MPLLVALACDHAGRNLKKVITDQLVVQGLTIIDMGLPDHLAKADYSDYARPVALALTGREVDFGILVCGTGLGMAMAANRFNGVRAAPCTNEFLARMARAHNDANILTLGERVTGEGLALSIVDIFLKTPFEGGRHQIRLDKIDKI